MYEWKIKVAKNLKELEKLVEKIQSEGWTIEKIDVKSVSVVAYKPKDGRSELLLDQQDEGRNTPHASKERCRNTEEWDRDYGQQSF